MTEDPFWCKKCETLNRNKCCCPKAVYEEDKFLVINRKLFKQLNDLEEFGISPAVRNLHNALADFRRACFTEINVNITTNKYYICNQDEPYAKDVIDIILEGESKKL